MKRNRAIAIVCLVMALGILGVRPSSAQPYPSRRITLVVPFAAGGPTDVIGRTLAEHMRESLGHPVVVENITGAAGGIGVARLARAAPDGYTLDIGQIGTHVFNGAIYPLQYDLLSDFEPISLIASTPLVIAARQSLPVNDLSSLIAWLRQNPNKASQASTGIGSQVLGTYFQTLTGTHFQFVPYRGAAPATQDLMAGQIDMMIDTPITIVPQARAGNIKALAVTAANHLSTAAEIPTVDEAGLPGLHFSPWFGLYAPRGTPKAVIAKLNVAVADALATATIRQRFSDLGFEIPPREQQTPEALDAVQRADVEKWWPIIKAAGIKGD